VSTSLEWPFILTSSSERSRGILFGGERCVSLIGQSSTKVDLNCTGSSSSDSFRISDWEEQDWRRAS